MKPPARRRTVRSLKNNIKSFTAKLSDTPDESYWSDANAAKHYLELFLIYLKNPKNFPNIRENLKKEHAALLRRVHNSYGAIPMKTLYVVSGQASEYDDRREWLVKAFRSKSSAEKFKIKCDNESLRIHTVFNRNDRVWEKAHTDKDPASFSKWDPSFQWEWCLTKYFIQEVPLV